MYIRLLPETIFRTDEVCQTHVKVDRPLLLMGFFDGLEVYHNVFGAASEQLHMTWAHRLPGLGYTRVHDKQYANVDVIVRA